MKKTQQKDATRNIRKRIVSYLSIVLVVGLGLGGLFTTRFVGAGIDRKGTEYFDAHNFKDYDFVSSYGISEANLNRIKSADKVTDAEGVIQADGSVSFNGSKRNVTIISLTERVSVPDVCEGRLPEGKNECMIGEDFAEVEGLKVGDKVRLSITGLTAFKEKMTADMSMDLETADGSADNAENTGDDAAEGKKKKSESPLYSKEFTITGLMHHPDFLRRKSVNTVSLPLSAFDTKVTEGLYTRAFVRIEQPEKTGMFDEKYFDETAATRKSFEALAEELEKDRTKEVKAQANKTIDEKWAEAEKKLADAQAQIDAGEAELNSKLAEGRNTLNSLQSELDSRIAEALASLANGTLTIPQFNKTINELKAALDEAQEKLDLMRTSFENEVRDIEPLLKSLNDLIGKVDPSDPVYIAAEKALAEYIVANPDEVRNIVDLAKSEGARELAKWIDGYIGSKKAETALDLLSSIDAEKIITEATRIHKGEEGAHFSEDVLGYIKDMLEAIGLIREQFDVAQKKIDDGRARIAEGERQAEAMIYAEKDRYQRQIDQGWATYYSEKSKYEAKLAEAVELLATNREKAEKKLAEARAEVDKIEPCEWIVIDRKGNAGYVDIKANLNAVSKMGVVFGLLFTIVTAIVCFSTLVIIIDEQKTLVGTSKAFGFHRSEVLGKYLVFGVSSAVVGSIVATIGAFLLSNMVQRKYAESGMYPLGVAKNVFTLGPIVIFSLLITAVTVAATIIACTDILRSPASLLMKGAVLKKEKKARPKKAASTKGTLYSRLIIRNMIEDKARVFVTVAIIAFSCMLIGIGITLKLAYDGMMNSQISAVNRFDIRMDMSDDVSAEDEAALVKVLERNGADFMPLTYQGTLYSWDGRLDGVTLICANPERIGAFYGICDPETGEDIPLPEDGVLIQKRMHESYGMDVGEELPVLDKSLKEHAAPIRGTFVNYVGRTVVLSPAAYKSIFGDVNKTNSYFIKAKGADIKKLQDELLAVSDDISFTARDEFRVKFESASKLYNILVYIITGIAILISFMILTNLANIYLNRKKTELTVMRVNGFTIKEVKGYLSRESILTTAAGLLFGVAAGAVLTPLIIKNMQQPDLEFIKTFQPVAWGSAVLLEAIFSLGINTMVYRKVRNLNLKDIA